MRSQRALLAAALLAASAAAFVAAVTLELDEPVLGFDPADFKELVEEIKYTSYVIQPTNDTMFFDVPGGKLATLFVRLQRYMFARGHLPMLYFGRVPPNVDASYESPMPYISRLFINKFWEETKDAIQPHSRCLEFLPAHYTLKQPHCSEVWVMDYEGDVAKHRVDHTGRVMYGDIVNLTAGVESMFASFDAIVLTNAIHLASDPHKAHANLFKLLKPGGVYLTSQPFVERDVTEVVKYYPDAYRFTDRVMMRILEEAGFQVERAYRGGNTLLSTGFLMGFGTADYAQDELNSLLRPALEGDDAYVGTAFVARKPHTAAHAVAAAQDHMQHGPEGHVHSSSSSSMGSSARGDGPQRQQIARRV